jgi:RHS repeat-associated protein
VRTNSAEFSERGPLAESAHLERPGVSGRELASEDGPTSIEQRVVKILEPCLALTISSEFPRDGVNSTIALTNGSATTTGTYSYSPYGNGASSGTAGTALQFTGREDDGTSGLYYYRARYYSPQLGRFISEDPIGLAGGTNVYAYVDGNPI